jgi:tetratricopeptide (TPR) repeat protein
MQAVFDASWELLTPTEQAVMTQLSVLHGRFSRDAAQAVAGVSLPGLLALVDKSLVRKRTEPGTAVTFQLHELLRQYAAKKLNHQPALEQEARERHGRYYAQFLQNHEKSLLQSGQKQALAAISAEIDNIRAAWQWLIQQQNQTLLDQALVGLYLFYWARSWLHEGFTAFQNAAAIIPDNDLLLARILWRQAEFAAWLSQFDEAQSLLTRSITILRATESRDELAMALEANGRLHYWQGHYTRARQHIEESLAICREINDPQGKAQALNSLANTICEEQADYAYAETLFAESLAIVQQLGDGFGIAKVLINQGATAQVTGDLERARQLMQESLTLYRDVEYQYGISAALSYLGQVTAQLGDNESAAELIQQSLDIHRESGNRRAIVDALEQLAQVVYKTGDAATAKRYYAEALHLAQALQSPRLVQSLLTAVAQLAFTEKHTIQAHKIINFVLSQPDLSSKLKGDAEQLLAQINIALPSGAVEPGETTAKALIQEILNKVLL